MLRSPPSGPLAAVLGISVLGACAAPPPAAVAPPCPSEAPAVTPAPAVSVAAAASAKPSASSSPSVAMHAPRDAAALGFCTAAEMSAARDEIDAIAKLVRGLPRDASPADAVTGRMVQLHASKCFAGGNLARDLNSRELAAARAWSVAKWWEEGGHTFFRAALERANVLQFAPSIPKLVAAELLSAGDPLHAIVCASSSATCDPLAQGAALDVGREVQRVSLLRALPRGTRAPQEGPATPEACAEDIRKEPPNERLSRFAACVDQLVVRRPVLPEARYRSPKGWLVLRGRRGHYSFCDEVRAYDLETGAAYVASRCSGLVLQNNGVVDQNATSAAGAVKTQVGTISVDALRRLALALWLKGAVHEGARPYAAFPLPAAVPMPDPKSGFSFGFGSGGGWGHSGQTRIHFEVVDGASTVLSGQFHWPDAYEIGEQVADDLVVSAEATLQEGCPKVALPSALVTPRSSGGVSAIDASPDALRKSSDELSAALAGLQKTKPCKKK